ncbi:formate/nitrite transporter family protein [Utexia brackfieldae]|uniref:formate/nitrite transporter family protein n=1 Tax=Utexia brackfieldae TaxID=3074108 RepID=UPI00370D843C
MKSAKQKTASKVDKTQPDTINIQTSDNINESKLPSKSAAIHQRILREGNKEMNRNASALLISAIAAGLTVSSSMIAKALLQAALPHFPYIHLIASFGYTVGFVLVILAKQQLFTENTVTAVLPVMTRPKSRNFMRLGRLWGLVLLGNLIGTFLMALALVKLPAFSPEVKSAFIDLGQKVMQNSAWAMFCKGIFAGWLIATLVWILANIKYGQFIVIVLITYIIALGDFTHIVVGSTEIFYLFLTGNITFIDILYPFAIPTLLGNIVGGTLIFSLLSHIEIRSDMGDFN